MLLKISTATNIKFKTLIFNFLLVFILCQLKYTSPVMAWDNLSGGDHDGDDWIISSDTTLAGSHTNIGTFRIESATTVTIESYNGTDYGSFSLEADSIEIIGNIDANSKGYRNSEGPGAGEDGTLGGSSGLACRQGGGGSYGGHGGVSAQTETASGPIYGSISTVNQMGSGGGDASSLLGGRGGGSIILSADSSFSLTGTISTNGANGSGGTYYNAGGGGSGGSVYIETNSISGAGTITANGGIGGDSKDGWGGSQCGDGGGGGGGRIYIEYSTGTYDISASAHSGAGPNGAKDGASGTIMLNNITAEISQVLLSDRSGSNQETPSRFPNTSNTVDNLILDENGYLILDSDTTLTVNNSIETRNNSRIDIIDSTGCDFSNATLNPKAGTAYINGVLEIANVNVISGTTLSHTSNPDDNQTYYLDLQISENLTIANGGAINTEGSGHAGGGYTLSGYGPGKGLVGGSWAGGGGGAHGGNAGRGSDKSAEVGGSPGEPYGNLVNPTQLGSGGGGSTGSAKTGGNGGGYLKITVLGTLLNNGTISADGQDAESDGNGGGGSGGSINITTNVLSGEGVISTNGGDGKKNTYVSGGGGSGGRIAIYYNTESNNTIDYQSSGGNKVDAGNANTGAAGTIYLKNRLNNYDKLIIDNSELQSQERTTPLNETGYSFSELQVAGKAYLTIQNSAEIMVTNTITCGGESIISDLEEGTFSTSNSKLELTNGYCYLNGTFTFDEANIDTGEYISHSSNPGDLQTNYLILNLNNDLSIDPSGGIDVSSQGHAGGGYTLSGYGLGKGFVGGTWAGAGGGAYGGNGGSGGNSSWGTGGSGGSEYGSETEPTHLGSGGGGSQGQAESGGNGGGYIKLNVEGNIENNGIISSNGGNSTGGSGAGGSGGSIHIITKTLTGSGSIGANGGNGTAGMYTQGGGGSGGRIAIYAGFNTITGGVTVTKGTGYLDGEDGTIYTEVLDVTAPTGTVNINSGAIYATETQVNLTISATDDLSGVDQMIISNSTDFSQSSWIAYSTSSSWALSSEQGNKTVYVKFKDVDGNESEIINDGIMLDNSAPTTSTFGKVGGGVSNSREITLNTSATDPYSSLYQMRTAIGSDCSSASWETYATTKNITLPNIEGFNIVCAQFKDNAGNLSSTYEATIRLDLYKPATFTKIVPENEASIDTNYPNLKWNKSSDSGVGLSKYTIYVDGIVYFDNITPELSTMIPAQLFSTYADPDKVIVYAPDFIELTPRSEEYQIDEGSHQWYIIATDGVGRTTQTSTWLFNIDTSEPTNDFIKPEVIIEEEPEEGIEDIAEPIIDEEGNTEFEADDSLPRFVGETEPESNVEITLNPDENPQIICRTTADSIGRWECKSTISIPNGKHNLMFEITDPAENTTTLLSSITINENLAETGKGIRFYLLLGFIISCMSLGSIIKQFNENLKNN